MTRWLASLVAVLSFALGVGAQDYARPRLLLEADALAKRPADWVVLDVRTRKKFEAGRVPGARWVDAPRWVSGFAGGKPSSAWNDRIGSLGVEPGTTVVVYDDTGSKDAAQIWWLLRYWGIEDVRLLHGGWNAWKSMERPLEKGPAPSVAKKTLDLKPRSERLATRESVLALVKDRKERIVDARTVGEFVGTEKFARRAGAIPGAIHLEWVQLLDPRTQRFHSAAELERIFRDAGIDPKEPVTAYCQSGRRSSVTVFALELLGNERARNYFASWAEWGNDDDTPVEPGQPRKR